MGGKACIAGDCRVTQSSTVLGLLAARYGLARPILGGHIHTSNNEDIDEALAYAAWRV